MIHIGHIIFPFKQGQQASSKLQKRMEEYVNSEQLLYTRYNYLEQKIRLLMEEQTEHPTDIFLEVRHIILNLIWSLNNEGEKIDNEVQDVRQIIGKTVSYLDALSTQNLQDQRRYIDDVFKYLHQFYKESPQYSYAQAAKILTSKSVDIDGAIRAAKCMYFARDYFNLKAILDIRKCIITNCIANDVCEINCMVKNPGSEPLALVFSDKVLLHQILSFYETWTAYEGSRNIDFNLEDNGQLDRKILNNLCILGYWRYLLAILIAIIQCDYTGYFDNSNVSPIFLKIYRIFGFNIFTSFYRNLSTTELLTLPSMIILEDVCNKVAASNSKTKLSDAHAMVSAISRDSALEDFSSIIGEIGSLALKEWREGSELSHIQMLRKFKDSRKYKKYYTKRGFERNLNTHLKEICVTNNIKRIAGIDIAARKK